MIAVGCFGAVAIKIATIPATSSPNSTTFDLRPDVITIHNAAIKRLPLAIARRSASTTSQKIRIWLSVSSAD
jgi:hypothetical protein